MKYAKLIAGLSLEEKCAMLSGEGVFRTRALKGIPSIWLSDEHIYRNNYYQQQRRIRI